MILVAVGTQLPFDRLVVAVDCWAAAAGRTDVIAQIGPSHYVPKAMKCFPFIAPDQFRKLQMDASLIVAHAGMGSILMAMELDKPIVIMPRDHTRSEHRNAHQMATARRFQATAGVYVAMNEGELVKVLDRQNELVAGGGAPSFASEGLISCLRTFIAEDPAPFGLGKLFDYAGAPFGKSARVNGRQR